MTIINEYYVLKSSTGRDVMTFENLARVRLFMEEDKRPKNLKVVKRTITEEPVDLTQ